MHSAALFDEIYQEHKNLVYNLCLHYTLNQEDAQDLTQEVFVKLYQHYQQYNPALASLKTWISRITVHQCLDFLKARRSQKRFGFIRSIFTGNTAEPIESVIVTDHPGVAAEDKEALYKLLRVIQMLPEQQKTVIILCKIEERPQKEVAEIMQTTVKAVESLMQRAKQNILKNLKDTEGL